MSSDYILTKDMSRAEWLSYRKDFVGASESAAIIGHHPYKTAVELYGEKIGMLEPAADNHLMRYGRDMEPIVAQWFMEDTGLKVRDDHKIRIHPTISHMACNLDRLGVSFDDNGPFVYEIKTTSDMAWKSQQQSMDAEDDNPVPYPHHYIQMQHQMSVTGWQHGYITYEISGFTKRLEHIYVKRNDGFISTLESSIKEFWQNNVIAEHPPEPSKRADIQLLYPDAKEGKTVEATKKVLFWLSCLKANTDEIKVLKEKSEEISAKIMGFMGDAEAMYYNDKKIISNKTTHRKGYTVEPTSYRNFRPNYNKIEEVTEQ